ncbi:hypothetical protein FPCIR_4222 [Fusarium pseudocircinatum]|uniref:Uncharacterized protein n=1 Tax=Fusarium pseudocircinatum TaxID=56676 RepID=A0A8H5PGJ2_9HYPO|nr:hypothetical protein FPCIR_4222 [Fusarium pseudocircinatum]
MKSPSAPEKLRELSNLISPQSSAESSENNPSGGEAEFCILILTRLSISSFREQDNMAHAKAQDALQKRYEEGSQSLEDPEVEHMISQADLQEMN